MAKIILGKRPESFKRKVTFPMIEGGEDGAINCTFKYRSKTEFGKFIDAMVADAKAADAKNKEADTQLDAPTMQLADIMAKTVDKNADYLLDILNGWDVEGSELTRDNCAILADELPGAAVAIMEAYRLAVSEGRLGN